MDKIELGLTFKVKIDLHMELVELFRSDIRNMYVYDNQIIRLV
jgi:hypothetical protein